MAEYPFIESPPGPDPVITALVEVLGECIAALRTSCDWIAQPPRRRILQVIADRAEKIVASSVGSESSDA